MVVAGVLLQEIPLKTVCQNHETIILMLAVIAMSEPTTTSRITFFIDTCFIVRRSLAYVSAYNAPKVDRG